MIPHYQIPRNTLLWLFATQILVFLPHVQRTPIWVMALLLCCMGWRLQVFRGRWNFPKKILKISALLACVVGLLMSFPAFFGLEALVSTLLVAYGLKLLEMHHKRDALILLYLSIFLLMTGFLFEQAITLAAFNVLVVMVILTAWSGLYQTEGHQDPRTSFQRMAILVFQALPLMVLMFAVLPRMPSFWTIPLQKNTPKTGMSDSMSPGDFGRLTLSRDPVMRITFQDASPPPQDLYWRGLVFSQFDGRRWGVEESPWGKPASFMLSYLEERDRKEFLKNIAAYGLQEHHDDTEPPWHYEVILEANQTPWLYALENTIPITTGIRVTHEHLLLKQGLVSQRFQYEAKSYLDNSETTLADWQRTMNLQLPPDLNPQAAALAKRWREESLTDAAYVQRVMSWFNQEFYYTLQPPTLGKNSVDEFLFQSKKGFCEHFASSFVFMLRAAGIPARVVVGYQGGELNPLENYYVVRQYDAHAWAEVWMENPQDSAITGWQRFDPTFAVAPHRILDGFRETFEENGELDFPITALEKYRDIAWVNLLRLQMDRLNYEWARWVLDYDAEKQFQLMTSLLGEYSIARLALFSVGFVVILMGLISLALWWQERDRTLDPVLRAYRRFCLRLSKRGYTLAPGETPVEFLLRVSTTDPDHYGYLREVSENLSRYWYQPEASTPEMEHYLCKTLRNV